MLIEKYDGRPVLVNDVMAWFAFDSMGEFMLNTDFDMMKSCTWHPAITQQRRALALLTPMTDAIWPMRLILAFFPFLARDWNQMVAFCDDAMQKRLEVGGSNMVKDHLHIDCHYRHR